MMPPWAKPCEFMIQGYYYSRPIPREEFEAKLESNESIVRKTDAPAAITVDNINAVLGADSLVTSLIDGILGGFGFYAFSNDRLEAIRVNKAYLELLGYPDMMRKSSFLSCNPRAGAFIEAAKRMACPWWSAPQTSMTRSKPRSMNLLRW